MSDVDRVRKNKRPGGGAYAPDGAWPKLEGKAIPHPDHATALDALNFVQGLSVDLRNKHALLWRMAEASFVIKVAEGGRVYGSAWRAFREALLAEGVKVPEGFYDDWRE